MRALDLAAGLIIVSVVVVCVGAVVMSARDAGRATGRRLLRGTAPAPPARRPLAPAPHRRAGHPSPEAARRRERAAMRPRRRE
jgi:hypothetical protein